MSSETTRSAEHAAPQHAAPEHAASEHAAPEHAAPEHAAARRPRLWGIVLLVLVSVIAVVEYWYLQQKYVLPLWIEIVLLLIPAIAVGHLGLSIVWRIYPPDEEDNDAVNAAFATIAAIFALLFGFVIVAVWEGHGETEDAVSREVDSIVELRQMSQGFPQAVSEQVYAATTAYAEHVVSEEWPRMRNGEKSEHADRALKDLWSAYTGMNREEKATAIYAQSIARLGDLGDSRRLRLEANESSVPPIMWWLLIAGAILTVFLAYLFRVSSTVLQRVLVTLMSGVLVLALFLIAALDQPYDNRLPVTPESMEQVLESD